MRIAIFTDTFAPEINGVSNTLLRLAEYFEERKIAFLFITPDYRTAGDAAGEQDPRIIRVRSVRAPFYENSRIALPSYTRIKESVGPFQPDLVHVTTALPIGWCGLKFAREQQLPLVMSYHTNFDLYLKYYKLEYLQNWLHKYLRWFHQHADMNLAPSVQTQRELLAKGYPRVGVWSRGIDSRLFQPDAHLDEHGGAWKPASAVGDRPISFLYVGRLAAEKNVSLLLDAIEGYNVSNPGRAQFTFTGDGPFREQIEARALPNVQLTGFKSGEALARVYAQADCFVCPSASETFGNVMLEAMSSGLPVICADRGGQLDFARNNWNALFFQHDNSESLVQALEKATNHPQFLLQLAERARETAVARSWPQVFDKLLADYQEVLAARLHHHHHPA